MLSGKLVWSIKSLKSVEKKVLDWKPCSFVIWQGSEAAKEAP